jgi:hypothetical protein
MPRLGTFQAALAIGLAACATGRLGAEAPLSDAGALGAIAAKLPPEVGEAARKWLHEDPKELKPMLAFSPASLEQEVMVALAGEPAAAGFVLGRMASEPAETDTLILKVIGFDPFWVDEPNVTAELRKLAEAAADPDLMLAYLDAECRIEARRMRRVLTERMANARKAGDAKALRELAAADERWIMIERGASIPGFMRKAPPVFAAAPAGGPVRIVGMGDFGSGTQAQRDVAAAIVQMGKSRPFDLRRRANPAKAELRPGLAPPIGRLRQPSGLGCNV